MARVTSDGQTRASTTSTLMSQTSHLRDIRQTGCDVMSVLVSQEADVLLANLAYGHDSDCYPALASRRVIEIARMMVLFLCNMIRMMT